MFEVLINFPHQIPSHHFFLCKTQYPYFQSSDFGKISLYRHRKIISCVCHFTIVTPDIITYYTVSLSFPGTQAEFSWVFQLYSLLWESQYETHILAQWNMTGHGLFASEPIGNLFYLHAVIFEIPKKCFIIKYQLAEARMFQ